MRSRSPLRGNRQARTSLTARRTFPPSPRLRRVRPKLGTEDDERRLDASSARQARDPSDGVSAGGGEDVLIAARR
jgi:hypothetical protein